MNIAHGSLTNTGRERCHTCKEVTDIGSDLLSSWLFVHVSSAAERCTRLGCLGLVWFGVYFFFWHWRMFLSPLSSSIPYSCCSQKQNTPSSAHEFLTAHIWTHHMSVICSQFPDPCVLSYSSRNYCRICWVCKFHTASLPTCGMRNTNYFGKAERLS